jgi:DNA polymerase-3 subunit delta
LADFTFLGALRRQGSVVAANKKAAGRRAGNIMAFVGSDEARLKAAALECFRTAVAPENVEFGAEIIDGIADNAEGAVNIVVQAIGALQTLPFFGSDKVVWLKGATLFADSQTGKAASVLDAVQSLSEVLEAGLPDGVKFLLSAPAIDKRRAFYKKLTKLGQVEVFDRPDLSRDGWQDRVKQYVRKLAGERKLEFDQEALELFVMLAGDDAAQIANELEKIDLFLTGNERLVSVDHVRNQVALTRAGVVFELGNNIARRNLAAALETIDQLLYQGENAIGILLAAVAPTLRRLLMAKELSERHGIRAARSFNAYQAEINRLPPAVTSHLPRKKDGTISCYPVFLAHEEARRFSSADLRAGLAGCLEANRALVTSSLDHRLILERLVVRLLATAA